MTEIVLIIIVGILLLVPLALVVGGIGLIVGAMQSIHNSLKGNKNG